MILKRHGFVVVLAVLLSQTGCSSLSYWWQNDRLVGPNFSPPMAQISTSWVDEVDEAIATNEPETDEWWQAFNDPKLDELVQAAYQNNLGLRTAALRVLEARVQRNITAANLLPQSQQASLQFSRNHISRNTANAFPFVPASFDDWRTGFDLSWEIDLWGRLRRAIEASDAAVAAEDELYNDVLVTLIGDVVSTYIEICSFDERIVLAEQNVEIQEGSLRIAEVRDQEGQDFELDVQQARTIVADTRALIPSLRQGRRVAFNRLALLLGTTPETLVPILESSTRIPTFPNHIVAGIPADLLRRRPDIRAAERQVAAQTAQIGIAEAELYPQFALSGELKFNAEGFSDLLDQNSGTGLIAPGFRWKILNYGRLVNAIRVEELQLEQALLNYENTVLAAHREVEDAIVSFIETQNRIDELEVSAAAAARAVELVSTQFRLGQVDFGRVFVVQTNLVVAQDRLVSARGEAAISLARAYKALGGGWQLRCYVPHVGFYPLDSIALATQEGDGEFDLNGSDDDEGESILDPANGSIEDSNEDSIPSAESNEEQGNSTPGLNAPTDTHGDSAQSTGHPRQPTTVAVSTNAR